MDDESEEKLGLLIKQIANGNSSAVDELYNIMCKTMFAIAYLCLRDQKDSNDTVHDAFLDIVKKANKFTSEDNAYNWINSITEQIALKKSKKRKK